MKYDSTDRTAFYAIMGLTILTGVICYFLFAAATPKPGIVDSIYRLNLPPKSAEAAANKTAAPAPIDESKFAKKVAIDIMNGASTQGNPSYGPDPATATSDALITWTNKDNAPHTVTSGTSLGDPKAGKLFDSGILAPGAKFSVPASKLGKGEVSVFCKLHPFMHGKITVT
ncbi:MAG TPA: hypothetical protein VIY08_02475 [Candidatus Nitrosocosmicus sp.]